MKAAATRELQLLRTLGFVLLIPGLIEALDTRFLVQVPGSPLSLGRLAFVGCGIIGILTATRPMLGTNTALGLVLIGIGGAIGSIASGDVADGASKAAGFLALILGATGIGFVLDEPRARKALDAFFAVTFAYWVFYTVSLGVSTGFRSYGEMFMMDTPGVVNHHIPGMYISVSSCYAATRFFFRNGRMRWPGYIVFGVGLLCCLYVESRSNFAIMALALMSIMVMERKLGRLLLVFLPAVVGIYLVLNQVVSNQEAIAQRFDLSDTDYQTRTTDSRFWLLAAGVQGFLDNPFGMGFTEIKLDFLDRRYLVHNQYLTFLLAGGIFALVGVVLWLKTALRVVRKHLFGRGLRREPDAMAMAMAMLAFHITLLTIEWTGLMFFFLISVILHLSGRGEPLAEPVRRWAPGAPPRSGGPSPRPGLYAP